MNLKYIVAYIIVMQSIVPKSKATIARAFAGTSSIKYRKPTEVLPAAHKPMTKSRACVRRTEFELINPKIVGAYTSIAAPHMSFRP